MNDTPRSFICPLTHDIMQDPVIDRQGYSYDRSALLEWLELNQISPITREPLDALTLVSNRALKDAIENYLVTIEGSASNVNVANEAGDTESNEVEKMQKGDKNKKLSNVTQFSNVNSSAFALAEALSRLYSASRDGSILLRLFFAGSCNSRGGCAYTIQEYNGRDICSEHFPLGELSTNNIADYIALILGLRKIATCHPTRTSNISLEVIGHSGIIRLLQSPSNILADLELFHNIVLELVSSFDSVRYTEVVSIQNQSAKALAVLSASQSIHKIPPQHMAVFNPCSSCLSSVKIFERTINATNDMYMGRTDR